MPRIVIGTLAAFAVLIVTFWIDLPQTPRAESGEAKKGGLPEAKKLTKLYYGVDACKKCHNLKEAVSDDDARLYRGTEMHTWFKFDKHKDAMTVLGKARGEQMGKTLGYDVSNDARCVNCHGVWITDKKFIDEESYGKAEQRIESGVSCVACHGAFEEWVNAHAPVVGSKWKKLTRTEKERDFGLNDLWDPVKRATLCCSCHVGDVQGGKVVTHEMYAAGHPPLPGFEIATFSDAMPRHWELLREKVKRRPKHAEFHKQVHYFDPGDMEQARMMTVTAVVSFRETMRLIAARAEQTEKAAKAEDREWPELAVFDCYACHHDLQSDSWRQKRGYKGKPGRPEMRSWSLALLHISIDFAAGKEHRATYDERMKDLVGVFSEQPFGEPAKVAKAARGLEKWADGLLEDLKQRPFDRAAAKQLLRSLAEFPKERVLDFDSARQVGWGFETLLAEADPELAKGEAVKEPLTKLRAELKLELPKGQVMIAGPFLEETLQAVRAYDPYQFRKRMEALGALVPK